MTADPVTRRPRWGDGLMLGRVAGVPVLLSPSWWLGAVVVTALYAPLVHGLLPQAGSLTTMVLAATLAMLLTVSVLIHELGHCAAARHLGIPVRRVRLSLLAGICELVRRPADPREECLLALVGPAVSILAALVAGAGWWALEPGGVPWLLVAELTVANAVVALFTLLPGLPLDGGRVLRAVVWTVTGRRGAGTIAAVVGAGMVAVGLIVWGALGVLGDAEGAWLRCAVCVLMAWFVVAGAGTEWGVEHLVWPEGLAVTPLVRPVLQLPAESAVADALTAGAGRDIVLVRADGIAAGLLDLPTAQRLAAAYPHTPAAQAAEQIRIGSIVRIGEPGHEILDRFRGTPHRRLLVVDSESRPVGVLRRDEVMRAVHDVSNH